MMTTQEFAETARVYYNVAAKWHSQAWLCSLRSKMQLERQEFERLALAAHQEGLIELARLDLCETADRRYLTESELTVPGGSGYTFHVMRSPEVAW